MERRNKILNNKYVLENVDTHDYQIHESVGYNLNEPNKKYSFFLFNHTNMNLYNQTIHITSKLSHRNIINIIDHGQGVIVENDIPTTIMYIMAEYFDRNFDLFTYISLPTRPFGENLGKIIFLKMLNIVEELYNIGIINKDIKAENIVLDDQFNLKFENLYSSTIRTSDDDKESNNTGTQAYFPPEQHLSKTYNGLKGLIFTLGIMMYIIVNRTIPFKSSRLTDAHYKFIVNDQVDVYWTSRNLALSLEFKDLFIKMTALDGDMRPGFAEIRNHLWLRDLNLEEGERLLIEELIIRRREIIAHMHRPEPNPERDNRYR
jgi:serine/threonine protein kinase